MEAREKEGCTYTALIQIAGVLEKNGIESEIFQAGTPELENVRAAAEKMKRGRCSDRRLSGILGISKRADHRIYG